MSVGCRGVGPNYKYSCTTHLGGVLMQSSLECGVAVEHLNLYCCHLRPLPTFALRPHDIIHGRQWSQAFPALPVFVHYCQLMQAKNKCQLTLFSLLCQHKLLVWMVLYLCIHYTSENCHTFQGMFISRAHRMDSSHSTLLARRGMLGLWSCSFWQGLGWTCRPRWALLQH